MTLPNRSFVFTFGYGQTHPVTGELLNNTFVEIAAPSWESARVEMCERFGKKWSFQYENRQAANVERYELRPIEGDAALGRRVLFCRECGEVERGTNPDRGGLCHPCADRLAAAERETERQRGFNSSQDPESHRGPDGVLESDFKDGSDS